MPISAQMLSLLSSFVYVADVKNNSIARELVKDTTGNTGFIARTVKQGRRSLKVNVSCKI